MAFVTDIEPDDRRFSRRHPTGTVCRYAVGRNNGQRILQLNSYGSASREFPDQFSQTLQFDERAARQLYDVLQTEFGF